MIGMPVNRAAMTDFEHTVAPFPSGLPERIHDASAWLGPSMATRSDWVEPLSPAELDELARACEPWLVEGTDLTTLTRERFVLPTVSARMAGVARLAEMRCKEVLEAVQAGDPLLNGES